jgi:hypothetical protein
MNGATLPSIAFYGSIEAEACCGMFAGSMVGSNRDCRGNRDAKAYDHIRAQ